MRTGQLLVGIAWAVIVSLEGIRIWREWMREVIVCKEAKSNGSEGRFYYLSNKVL